MQQCQDQLEFNIETPDDKELARRFADRQRELAVKGFQAPPKHNHHAGKARNRKSKHQKKMERINRDKSTTI